jgi:hypothetical protein
MYSVHTVLPPFLAPLMIFQHMEPFEQWTVVRRTSAHWKRWVENLFKSRLEESAVGFSNDGCW